MPSERGVPVDRADRDRGNHDNPERTQRVALAAEPLVGACLRVCLAGAMGRIHG